MYKELSNASEALGRRIFPIRLSIRITLSPAHFNLIAERALSPVAIGRRNYLFTGSNAGGQRAAILYSLTARARLNGWTPRPTCTLYSLALASVRSSASRNCCHETSPEN